jgi:integrase/recombinase XerD
MVMKKKVISLPEDNERRTVEKGFMEFIQSCKIKNLSPYTITSYELHFKRFESFLVKNNIMILDKITKDYLNNYIIHLKGELQNPISVNTYLRSARAFLYFCMKLGYLKDFKVELIKAEKKIKETYTDSELKLLLKKPNLKKDSFVEYRDWVIVNFLIGTGVRLLTLINIKIKDIDCDSGFFITRHSKNKRQQMIPLPTSLINILLEYLNYRKGKDEDFLFCTVSAEQLSRNSITNTIRWYNENRGINKTSIHLFRHTFAKLYILNGGDIFRLQKLLGHSSIEMVREYVEMFSTDLQKDYDNYNPLEQLTKNKMFIRMQK